MPAVDEFVGPVGYGAPWTWLPMLLVAAVVAYYAWALTRSTGTEEPDDGYPRQDPVEDARKRRLGDIDRIDSAFRQDRITLRAAYQQLSAALRGFVGDVTDLPARAMTLEELRDATDPRVADTIEAMYPPEFAPGETAGADDFARSVLQARELVRTWR
jgi:hypothetical protein